MCVERQLIQRSAEKLIIQEQPFQQGERFNIHMLWGLQEMDNTNKHQLLVVAAAMATFQNMGVDGGDRNITIIGMSPPKGPVRPSVEGTEMFTVFFGDDYHDGIELKPEQILEIAFERVGPIKGVPVVENLTKARRYVGDLIGRLAPEISSRRSE